MATSRFGLTSTLDNTVVDAVLAALEVHDHTGGSRLGDPVGTASATLITTRGALPGSSTYVYRYALIDQYGFETAASPEITQSTPAILTPPGLPAVTSADGGLLPQGIYYVYLTTVAGSEETGLSQPAMASLITGEGTLVVTAPTYKPESATGWRVWRQGPGESAPTKVGLMALTDLEFRDTGAVPADACACDPDNQPPAFNRTNSTNSITISLSADDAALVTQTHSPVLRWRLYRATSSGGFSSSSLLHQVVELDSNGKLLTSWTDDGSETQVAGRPTDISRTLKPSVAIKRTGAAGAGALQVHGSTGMWALTADLAGALVTEPSGFLPVPQAYLYLTAPDASTWKIDVDPDGSLITSAATPTGSDEIYLSGGPVLATIDATLGYQLGVDATGVLSTVAVGVSHLPSTSSSSGGGGSAVGDGPPTGTAPLGSTYLDRTADYRPYVFDTNGWRTHGDFPDLNFNSNGVDLRVVAEEVDPENPNQRALTVRWAFRGATPLYGWFIQSHGGSAVSQPGVQALGLYVTGAAGDTVTVTLAPSVSNFADYVTVASVDHVLGSLL